MREARALALPFLDERDLARLERTTRAEIRRRPKSGDSPSGLVIRGRLVFTPEAVIDWLENRQRCAASQPRAGAAA